MGKAVCSSLARLNIASQRSGLPILSAFALARVWRNPVLCGSSTTQVGIDRGEEVRDTSTYVVENPTFRCVSLALQIIKLKSTEFHFLILNTRSNNP